MAERKPLPGWVVWSRRLLIGCGTVALAYAVSGAIASPDMRLTYLRFLGAVLVGHDLILLPVAIAVGVHQGNADGLLLTAGLAGRRGGLDHRVGFR